MTKQTGPAHPVKGLGLLAALILAASLAGCHGGRTHPTKSAAEMKADMAECDHLSEEDALMRAGRPRGDYGLPPGAPSAGGYGPSPMEMHDRDAVVQDFRDSYDNCLSSKGYRREKPAAD